MIAAPVERVAEFTLYDVQDDFVADTARYPAFVAGRNSGKTYAGSVKAALRCLNPGLGVIAAPDFPMLEHGAKRQFLERLDELGLSYVENKQKGTLLVPRTGAEVLFATLDNESRVRSPNFYWGWVDELEYLIERRVWQALKGAVRAGDWPQLWATSTPKGRKRIIYPEWIMTPDALHTLHRASSLDNPFHDAAGYVAALGYEGAFYRQEIEASFEAFEGVIYSEFSRDRNVAATDTDGWRCVLGVDVGSRNPTGVLVAKIAGDGRFHIEREHYQRGMSSSDILATIKEYADAENPEAIYIDPSAAGYVLDLQREGFPVIKANNDVIVGIQRVQTVIHDGLTIDPGCLNLIDEMESYAWMDNGRTETDKPVKQNDHLCDALRYLCLGEADPLPTPGIW